MRTFGGNVQSYRSSLIPVLLVGCILVIGMVFNLWLISGGTRQLLWGLAVGVVVTIVIFTLLNWRWGLYLFLLWLIFEDLIRKFLGNNMTVYFAKDLILAVVFLSFLLPLLHHRIRTFHPPFLVPLLLFVGYGIAQVFNPNSPHLFYGLVGLKLYFYYIPLMYLGYAFLSSREDLDRFLQFNLAIASIVALLGIIQAITGNQFLNPANPDPALEPLMYLERVSPITGLTLNRPTSIFVSDGRFGSYLILAWILGLGALFMVFLRRGNKLLPALFVGFIAGAILLHGGRGLFCYSGATVLFFIWVLFKAEKRGFVHSKLLYSLTQGSLAVGLALILLVTLFPEKVQARWAFYYETISPWSPASELTHRIKNYPLGNFLAAFTTPYWLLGSGIGTVSLGGQYVARITGVNPSGGVESGWGSIVWELGVPGLLLWFLWTTSLVISLWRVLSSLRGSDLFPVGFAIFWFAFLLLFPFTYGGLQSYQNFILNAYLWLLTGILFRLANWVESPTLSSEVKQVGVPRYVG